MHTVGRLMTGQVATTVAAAPVSEVRDLMQERSIAAVPVVDERGHPAGILTTTDLVGAPDAARPVGELMSTSVVTVSATTDVTEAASLMRTRHLHHLLVTDAGGGLAGIVSSWDLLEELAEALRTLTAGAVERPFLEVGDRVVERPLGEALATREGAVTQVGGADGAPPWVVQWDDAGGEARELSVVRRDDFVLDSCER